MRYGDEHDDAPVIEVDGANYVGPWEDPIDPGAWQLPDWADPTEYSAFPKAKLGPWLALGLVAATLWLTLRK